jgi:putative ABC transport system permease protein
MWRKLRADIKTQKLQFFIIWSVLTLSAMLLTISILVMDSADEPWDRTFEETNGPHAWFVSLNYDEDFSSITRDEAVSESTDIMHSLAENPLVLGDEKQPIFIYAMDERPQVGRPKVAEGRWLDKGNPNEIVLDYSLARFYEIQTGERVEILGAQGVESLEVVGLAVTGHWFPFNQITKDVSPGVAYTTDAALEVIQPDTNHWYGVIGLRLKEPDTSVEFVDRVLENFTGQMRTPIEWQWVKTYATYANTMNVLFMGLFSTLGLAAVGLIIFNTIGGQVLSQYQEIGFLKAAGFKPSQVTLLFLAEHLFIGLLAALVGIGAGLAMSPGLISPLAENLNTTPPDPNPAGLFVTVPLLVEVVVALATLLPAWQGGRINTVQAITVGYRQRYQRVSLLARIAAWLRLPEVVVLGVKDTFSRPLRAVLAITSLVLTVLIAITAVGAQTTTEYLSNNRVYSNGTSADMKVERNFLPHTMIQSDIVGHPEVTNSYEEFPAWGQAPGHSDQPITYRMLSGDYQDFDFQLKEGRLFSAPGEAVVGYAILDMLDVEVGDTVDLIVEGRPIELTIVGRTLDGSNMGNYVLSSLETYHKQVDSQAQPTVYYLRLADYGEAKGLRDDWMEQTQGLMDISVVTNEPQASMEQLKDLIVGLGAIMMVVAGANLMSNSLLSIRERVRDFGIQKALGMTPAQIAANVMVGTVTIAVLAIFIGIPVGVWFMQEFVGQLGVEIGAGPDFYIIHWGGLSTLLPIMVLLAVASSVLPATRAAQLEVTEALKYE